MWAASTGATTSCWTTCGSRRSSPARIPMTSSRAASPPRPTPSSGTPPASASSAATAGSSSTRNTARAWISRCSSGPSPSVPAPRSRCSVDVAGFFLALAAILVAAKLLGELAERIGQPAVLGELVAGVLLGGSVLAIVPQAGLPGQMLHVLAEFGVLLLLFESGLETDLREMSRVGPASLAVAVVGVIAPFGLGYAYWAATGHSAASAIFVGATLTATSVGITARVLSDLGRMATQEARVIIGAAVIDDVLGLVILSVVTGVAAGAGVTVLAATRTLAVAVGFLVVAVLLGRFLMPRLFDLVVRMRVRYVLLVCAVAFALGLSALAALAGSALIIGAFAAGLIL